MNKAIVERAQEKCGQRKQRQPLKLGTEVWLQDAKTGGTSAENFFSRIKPVGEMITFIIGADDVGSWYEN